MMPRRVLPVCFCTLMIASLSQVQAQESDDLLAPLTPTGKKSDGKKRKKPRTAPAAEEVEVAGKALLSFSFSKEGEGARLFIDGDEVGVLHAEEPPRPISPGSHRILVKRLGRKDFSTTLSVKTGSVTQVQVSLEPVAGVAHLLSEPPGAEVSLDGVKVGVTPLRDLEILPGAHHVVFRRAGFSTYTEKLTVDAGRVYTLAAKLLQGAPDRPERNRLSPPAGMADPSPLEGAVVAKAEPGMPWYSHWYVWAGAAVVAGAAVGVAVATHPRALSAQQVCGDAPCTLVNGPVSGLVRVPEDTALLHF